MRVTIQYDREENGRWIADIPALPGVMAYGQTKAEARDTAIRLGRSVLAENMESEAGQERHEHFALA